jgi:hypothetical protein
VLLFCEETDHFFHGIHHRELHRIGPWHGSLEFMELVPQKQQVEVERRNSCSAVDHLESVVLRERERERER